jgi:hypothetical protein
MSITLQKEKSLREYGAPYMGARSPIIYPTNYAPEYSIDTELISIVESHSLSGREDEDPQTHLMTFDALCGTFKIKDVSREFVFLKLFRWPLKDKAEECRWLLVFLYVFL